jgi:hypothetical protein
MSWLMAASDESEGAVTPVPKLGPWSLGVCGAGTAGRYGPAVVGAPPEELIYQSQPTRMTRIRTIRAIAVLVVLDIFFRYMRL